MNPYVKCISGSIIRDVSIYEDPSVVLYSTINPNAGGDREIAFFARPFYEVPKIPYDFSQLNLLEAPWLLAHGTSEYHGIYANCDAQAGTIWTYTVSGHPVEGARLITLNKDHHNLLLPAGHYILTGAPRHRDRRANLNHKYWGLRVEFVGEVGSLNYTEYGFTGSSYSGDCQAVSGSDFEVWDRGFGAKFELTNAMNEMNVRIHISQCPVQNGVEYANTDPNEDVWRPCVMLDPDYL